MQQVQEISSHCWFWLVPSRSHSRNVHQEIKKKKGKSLVQEIWYKVLHFEMQPYKEA